LGACPDFSGVRGLYPLNVSVPATISRFR